MKTFMDENFLLTNAVSEDLYHNHAAKMPIIDYHNHLPPEDIASDRSFANMAEATLEGDHYKWRGMRGNGVDEHFITGAAKPEEKWQKWAETIPYTMRNPLYHWQHLELQRYFGINETLNGDNAQKIYGMCNEQLLSQSHSCRNLLRQQNVAVLCTTDDPTDNLEYHKTCAEEISDFKSLPTFRPDKAIALEDLCAWNEWQDRLASVSGQSISNFDDSLKALKLRHDYFHEKGCRLSDHGLPRAYHCEFSSADVSAAFAKARAEQDLNEQEKEILCTAYMQAFARWNAEKDWAMQLHLGPMRNNNTKMFGIAGRDAGFDSMNDLPIAEKLSRFLDSLAVEDQLPKTILYNLNPKDNAVLGTMIGNFQQAPTAGKIQFGSGWWFLDQLDGMEKQMNDLSSFGLISKFVGMLTDSRSFLSFPRHEYFRRLLCDLFGRDVASGKLPDDRKFLAQMIEDISYNNAKNYFKF
ncbi:glucuronate isomerase [Lentisphaera profundi]|uniref:Uronate isomerase n=1 Tax=Lentisphaera profundi TaxID=1658616 RepID=A0ABY7VNN6_9BACT|nr:glucuronate isomerase [Lentisphaera profundi]WDE95537.1 glucuronate isomerase [Lentisphaera profundi]